MENYIHWLADNVPQYVWQICLFLMPANPVLRFIFGKIGYVPGNTQLETASPK